MLLYVAKYHLGKVKPERVGQRSPPSQYVTFGAALRALLTLVFFAAFVAFAVLLCLLIVADHFRISLLADRLGSFLLLATVSRSLSTLPRGGGGGGSRVWVFVR